MNKTFNKALAIAIGLVLALLSAFLVFYTARLLYVTRGLTTIRIGGQGAYIGAVVFPLAGTVVRLGRLAVFACSASVIRRAIGSRRKEKPRSVRGFSPYVSRPQTRFYRSFAFLLRPARLS